MGMDIGSYAMGWECRVTGKSRIVWHSGIVPDFGAVARSCRIRRKALSCSTTPTSHGQDDL